MQLSLRKNAYRGRIKGLLIGAALGHAITSILLILSAVLIWKGAIPENVSKELSLACLIVGSMIAGRAAAGEGRSIALGVLGGAAYLLMATIIGLYRTQTDYFDLDYVRFLIAIAAGSAFGGIISTGKKNKKRISRRK